MSRPDWHMRTLTGAARTKNGKFKPLFQMSDADGNPAIIADAEFDTEDLATAEANKLNAIIVTAITEATLKVNGRIVATATRIDERTCAVCGQDVVIDSFGTVVSTRRGEILRELKEIGYSRRACKCCGGPQAS